MRRLCSHFDMAYRTRVVYIDLIDFYRRICSANHVAALAITTIATVHFSFCVWAFFPCDRRIYYR